ncbi:MAG: DUF177 domain-containing protein [Thermodesulfobacteriaceae bacterium]|nr:DUF177 domain-containing protein [Thermodesulfobacteriaceae bacterium]MCX8040944.1 DUF177 domain-containing protein [Thermodesulfobacteriaceae bacterium]MDW8135700.1 DUF177 domain-containing protein [Thermodesulfobacterium sp.]
MTGLKNWGISLDEIPLEGLKVEFSELFDLGEEIKIAKPLTGFLHLKKIGVEVEVIGYLEGTIILDCDRCLSPYKFEIKKNWSLELKPLNFLNLEEERELKEEEMEVDFYENNWISFLDLIKEEIYLSIPYKKLCKEDCKGICQVCGVNLNEMLCKCKVYKKESPFAILKDIFLKNLEKGG